MACAAHSIDLGMGHIATEVVSDFPDGKRLAGFIIDHLSAMNPATQCTGYVAVRATEDDVRYGRAVWTMESPAEGEAGPLTLSPSILCACGDHGFIRESVWIPA